jgi:hypothetical protein
MSKPRSIDPTRRSHDRARLPLGWLTRVLEENRCPRHQLARNLEARRQKAAVTRTPSVATCLRRLRRRPPGLPLDGVQITGVRLDPWCGWVRDSERSFGMLTIDRVTERNALHGPSNPTGMTAMPSGRQ